MPEVPVSLLYPGGQRLRLHPDRQAPAGMQAGEGLCPVRARAQDRVVDKLPGPAPARTLEDREFNDYLSDVIGRQGAPVITKRRVIYPNQHLGDPEAEGQGGRTGGQTGEPNRSVAEETP